MFTKILSGTYRGQKLKAPKENVRPTKSIVRKSFIDQIRFDLPESAFLDLFAGCGAMGLEALSNGAKMCYFVDLAKDSIAAIHANIQKLDLLQQTKVLQMDAFDAMEYFDQEKQKFNFIFADPPYDLGLDLDTLKQIDELNLLQPEGSFFLETNQQIDCKLSHLVQVDKRKFGKSYLYQFQK